MSLHENETESKTLQQKFQKCLQVKNFVMKMTGISKRQIGALNDKRYYFSDRIVSFSIGHPYLKEIRKYKKEVKDNMQKVIKENQFEMLSIETKAATTCE